jgi:hypothetical protein
LTGSCPGVLEGLWPDDRTYLEPIAAAASMGVALVALEWVLSGIAFLGQYRAWLPGSRVR